MVENFIVESSGLHIKCLRFFEVNRSVNSVILVCHGFAGHKESVAIDMFAKRLLELNPHCAVIAFDLPGHGDDGDTRLTLENCDRYFTALIDYIHTQYKSAGLFFYGTSFGGYLGLKYIAQHGDLFEKTVLRCPAVDMENTLRTKLFNASDNEALDKGEARYIGFDKLVRVEKFFLDELSNNPIKNNDFSRFADSILIIQGTDDELLDFGYINAFADRNNIKFISSPNTDHRFLDNDRMREAINRTIDFMGLG